MRRTRIRTRRPRVHRLVALGLVAAFVTGACTNNGTPAASRGSRSKAIEPAATKLIEQPAVGDLQVAPDSSRVDLAMPTFSDPTNVTNPLFPVTMQESVLLLGKVDGKAFRTEVTLLPDPRIIEWQGHEVPTLVSQYVAYLNGRIHEVAYDFYAQADDGSVWYFGEDVYNFMDGAIVDTHGTWIAGKDGPAAMIMPADPQVGDVYRPENIPGFVFEEVTVKSVGKSLNGPLGSIDGGLVIEELHMDGTTEAKSFAPGYGEFFTSGGGDVEALALAVPTDSLSESSPEELSALQRWWADVFDAAGSENWRKASGAVEKMIGAWETYRARGVPKRVEARIAGSLAALADAVTSHKSTRAQQSAINVAQSILDLRLHYRPAVEIDLARFDLWLVQLAADASRGDADAVNGDFFTLDYIRDRILHVLNSSDVVRVNSRLEELAEAVGEAKLGAAAKAAVKLRHTIAELGV